MPQDRWTGKGRVMNSSSNPAEADALTIGVEAEIAVRKIRHLARAIGDLIEHNGSNEGADAETCETCRTIAECIAEIAERTVGDLLLIKRPAG